MKKRILSIVLAICLVLALVPTIAFAGSVSHTVTVNAGEGGKVSTDGSSWTDSVAVTVNDGETLNGKLQYKADEGYTFDGVAPKIVSVASGINHTVLLDANGNVWTAGFNFDGELGRDENAGTYNANPTFTQVTNGISGVKITAIATGNYHTVLLDADGNVWTAGYNYNGQLGRDENAGTDNANPTFTKVTDGISGVKITAIAAGNYHTVLLDADGNVWTAGYNYHGQLGRDENAGTNKANPTFTKVTDGISGVKITAIAAGNYHTVLLDADGNVWTAGFNNCGQLGRDENAGTYIANPTFTQVTNGISGVKITAIAAGGGGNHTVLLDENNNVWTAGNNFYGQLGRDENAGTDNAKPTFTQVTNGISGVKITAIAAGKYHTVLLDANGTVWTAGYNYYGQLGRDENAGTYNANPTFKQAAVNPDAITFEELLNTPIYNNSVFLVKFKVIQKPVITGLETNKTYCDAVEFEVSDDDGIASVKAGNEALTAGTNGKYILAKGIGTVKVVVTDTTDNTTEVTVTVNNGHTDEDKNHNCDFCNVKLSSHSGGEATCIDKAVCSVCGVQYGEVDASNHKHTEVRDAKDATCCEAGYTGDTWCTDCNTKIASGEAIPATGNHVDVDGNWESDGTNHYHTCYFGTKFDVTAHSGGEATCKDKAICSVCGTAYGEVNASNHKGTTYIKDQKEATCYEEGYTGDTYCSDCNAKLNAGTVIGKSAHNPASVWSTDETYHWKDCQTVGCGNLIDKAEHSGGEATCIAKAVCSVCGAQYGEVDASNHKHTEVRDAKSATCCEEGYTGDTWCTDCNKKIATGTTIPATGNHVDVDGKWESDGTNHYHTCYFGTKFDVTAHSGGEATCIAKAVCSVCGAQYGEVDASNHKHTEVRDAKSATCCEAGYTGDTWCTDCNKKIATGTTIPATGNHVDVDGKWESDGTNHYHTCYFGTKFDVTAHSGGEATCKDKAVCSVCKTAYGEVNASNHKGTTYIKDQKEATCYEEGYTGDTYCSDCDVKIKDGTVIDKSAHNPASVWTTDETYHWKDCQTVGCGNLIDKAEHSGGEATCIAKAVCSVCGAQYGEVDASNHKHTEVRDAKDATCSEAGYTGDTWCTDCNKMIAEGEDIEKLEHKLVLVKAEEATAAKEGNIKYYHCENCGKDYYDEAGSEEIATKEAIVIRKLAPKIIDGNNVKFDKSSKESVSFRSDAAFADFIRVEVDGKELVKDKDYTLKEGSIIASLTPGFVDTLTVGEHTLGIVSASGTAVATFTVTADTVLDDSGNNNSEKAPQTGGNSNIIFWSFVAVISLAALSVTGIKSKKKKVR